MAKAATAVALAKPPDFPHGGVMGNDAIQAMLRRFYHTPFEVSGDGTIDQTVQGRYFITKAGVCALVLPAPTVGDDDNTEIEFVSTTASAHTVTATGILMTGAAAVNKGTFAAQKGASLRLVAYQGKWYVLGSNQITFA